VVLALLSFSLPSLLLPQHSTLSHILPLRLPFNNCSPHTPLLPSEGPTPAARGASENPKTKFPTSSIKKNGLYFRKSRVYWIPKFLRACIV
jgi:hypothetical protein